MRKLEPVTIDPRRIDAVLLSPGVAAAPDVAETLAPQLHEAGVRTGDLPDGSRDALLHAADLLSARPGRCAVVVTDPNGVSTAREAGFALVVGVGRASAGMGADAIVTDLRGLVVRTGVRRMSELPDGLTAFDLAARTPTVFFDFDGTLSDIVNDPGDARPAPGVSEALENLAAQCVVAVLSGRDLADVSERVGLPGIWYAGSHGFESTAPDGTHHQNDAAAAAIPILEQAAAQLREELADIPGVAVEHKRFGVAVHFRNVARDRVGAVSATVRKAGQRDELRVTTGREVIELRPDVDWDKGKTLRWVMDHVQHEGSAAPVPIYLGDDITDEDAFDAIQSDGIPILVRHNDDGDRATAARLALDSPTRVGEFTARLARRLSDARVNSLRADPPGSC